MPRSLATLALALFTAIACRAPVRERMGRFASGEVSRTVAGREYALEVPPAARLGKPLPLIVVLHGYGSSGLEQATYFGLNGQAAARSFLLAKPDGTRDGRGVRYWNAYFPECCASAAGPPAVDDESFLMALVRDVASAYPVDPERVYLMGHSNGAFMAYRMACDHAETFAGIVALAGAADPDHCVPSRPVSVMAVHGTSDRVIEIGGGQSLRVTGHPYASLAETVGVWVKADGCTGPLAPVGRDNLVNDAEPRSLAISGAETVIERASGCADGTDVEAWKIEGAGHIPLWNKARWPAAALDFLLAHHRAPR